jgi:CubicO group peptidase (beta-lactamase class C family)
MKSRVIATTLGNSLSVVQTEFQQMIEETKYPVAILTRRSFCARALAGSAVGVAATALKGAVQGAAESKQLYRFKADELQQLKATGSAFMEKHRVPALSLAIAKDGRLVYAEAFGLADKENSEKVTVSHLFRIASVSKPITATTIFRFIEAGRLRLSDKVFGLKGILGTMYGKPPYRQYVEDITLEHLLNHTAGGWPNDSDDPMFQHTGMDHQQLITGTLANLPLRHSPGTHFAYSNFGFCILGRIIEKVTGKPYEEAVQTEVLTPCGISRMRISGNSRSDRAPHEVIYYNQDEDGASPYEMNVRRMDSHGGWLATPTDLVRFLVHVDKFPTKPDILRPETIELMTAASPTSPGYAKGWNVNKFNNWWHAGSLPGTTTIMVRTSQQFCWAALTNTRGPGDLGGDLDRLVWDMVGKITCWPDHDLFATAVRTGSAWC